MDVPSVSKENENQEKDEGVVVTMVDVLEEENELEEDVNAVLGGSDDKTCTYSKVCTMIDINAIAGFFFRQSDDDNMLFRAMSQGNLFIHARLATQQAAEFWLGFA